MSEKDKEQPVPAVATKPAAKKAEPPDQTAARRAQIARHIAGMAKVLPSRVDVRYLYSKELNHESMYRAHVRDDHRKILSSHFVTVSNPINNQRGWSTQLTLMLALDPVLTASPPVVALRS